MKHLVGMFVGLLLLFVAGAVPAWAQEPWDREPWDDRERGGVTLHRDLDFTGVSQTFDRDVPDLRGTRIGSDHATSVSVDRGCTARLYRDVNYRGAFSEVRSDVRDLRGSRVGDDTISSLQVRCDGGWGGDDDGPRRGVTLHRDLNYAGVHQTFDRDMPDLRGTRVGDDHATSVSLSRGCTARLYRDTNFRGEYSEVRDDIPDLRRSRVGDDAVSSLQVRCGGRGGGWEDGGWDDGGGEWEGGRGVTLHRDLNFTGVSETFRGDVPDLGPTRIGNDHATSVSVGGDCTARLYRDSNYRGPYTEVDSDVRDLRGSRVGDDSVSSIQVRCR